MATKKLTPLEAVRGIAACVVVLSHFLHAYRPALSHAMVGTPLVVLINGKAAVMLFFVLSGFVLTLRPLQTGAGTFTVALKRWPRLAGPVLVSSLFYIAGAATGAFPPVPYVLAHMPNFADGMLWGTNLHGEQVGDTLWEAAVRTFTVGTAAHNDVLWSMHWEFLGSLLVLALTAALRMGRVVLLLTALLIVHFLDETYYVCFVAGFLLAYVDHMLTRQPVMPGWLAAGCGIAATLLFSLTDLGPGHTTDHPLWIVVARTAGSVIFISVALYNPSVRRVLSVPAFALLGRMSFAIYLLHPFVLWSFTSWMCVWLGTAVLPAWMLAATAAVIWAVAYPLMRFDEWWVRTLNRGIRRLQTRRVGPISGSPHDLYKIVH